jgi:molybdopterin converting factor small subunit
MPVSVLIPDELKKYADGQLQIEVEATTVGDALERLFVSLPNLQKRLVDGNRHFYPYVPAFLNDEKLPLQGTLNRRLNDGDQLAFMLIASGG